MLQTGPHLPCYYVANDARTLGGMFRERAERSQGRPAFYEKREGSWARTSWAGFYDRARQVAAGLRSSGVQPGDRVAILGPTHAPWAYYDMGAQLAGAVSLGIYPKQSVDQVRYIIDHSDTKVVFVDDPVELQTVLAACRGLDKVVAIVPWDADLLASVSGRDERLVSPERFAGEPLDHDDISAIQATLDPNQTAILIYTSGTTGPPKGAMITHKNILQLLRHQSGLLEMYEDDLSFNFLPMAHAAERVLGFYGRINSGVTTAYATSMGTVLTEVQQVRPTLFGSVPRIFEKAYAKIHAEVEKSKAKQRVVGFAKEIGAQALPYHLSGKPLPFALSLKYALADALVFSKVRDAFGGRVRWFVTGAAPIAMDILEFFWAANMHIFEAYGMTEATVITHINSPGNVKLGSVGKVVAGMQAKIAEDGEVLMRGPLVFQGYFKNEEATRSALIDGWLHSGDIGKIDKDGYLRITDRKKHLIITAGGKNLAPANIENAIKNQSPLISQVHAHGDKRPYVSALVVPSPIETLELGVELGLVDEATLEQHTRELMANPAGRSEALGEAMAPVIVHASYIDRAREAVAAGNLELAKVEQVRRFTILDRDFSQEHGELTPTMKVKRKTVETKFAKLFDRIYDDEDFGIEP